MLIVFAVLWVLAWLLKPLMPLTGEMLNAQGNATTRVEKPAISPAYLSLGKVGSEVVPEASAAGKKIKKTAHGLTTKAFVVLVELNGKTTFGAEEGGLIVGFGYWVHEVSSSEYALAYTKAQCESATESEWVAFTVEVKATSKFATVVEATVVGRSAATWVAAANGVNKLESAVTVESNANTQEIRWLLGYSASTAGTLCLVEKAEEPFRTLNTGDKYEVPSSLSQISQLAVVK